MKTFWCRTLGTLLLSLFGCLNVVLAEENPTTLFADPPRGLYAAISIGMRHTEVNELLRRYSTDGHSWEIYERDLIERADLWSETVWYSVKSLFAETDDTIVISTHLYIYFFGTRVGCLLYRYEEEGYVEELHRGDLCHHFGVKNKKRSDLRFFHVAL